MGVGSLQHLQKLSASPQKSGGFGMRRLPSLSMSKMNALSQHKDDLSNDADSPSPGAKSPGIVKFQRPAGLSLNSIGNLELRKSRTESFAFASPEK